jgi:hypothetical protein
MSRAYKSGLEGNKPGFIDHLLDDQTVRDQERGYEDYLKNKDLVERISEAVEARDKSPLRSSWGSDPAPYSPSLALRILFIVYWVAAASLVIWYLVLAIRLNSGQMAIEAMEQTLTQLWSPTSDVVLNFLINSALVIVGVPILIGSVVVALVFAAIALCLYIALMIVLMILWLLLTLATASTTGLVLTGTAAAGSEALRRLRLVCS